MSEGITAIMDQEREALVAEALSIRDCRAWVMLDGERWYAMRIGELVATGEGATVEEALAGLEVMA